jgi:phage tail sheath protein FI
MPEYLAPGVFVEEVSFRAKTIEGVSTTTTGFVGAARFGPVHLEPDILTSLEDYQRSYEVPGSLGHELMFGSDRTPNHLWHAVRAFFTEGGKRLYVSRVFRSVDPAWRFAPLTADDEAAAAPATSAGLYHDGIARVAASGTAGLRLRARHPGAAANLRLRITLKAGPNVLVGQVDPASGATVATLKSATDRDLVWVRDRSSSPSMMDSGAFALLHRDEERASWRLEPLQVSSPVEAGDWFDVASLNPDPVPDQGDSVRVVTLTLSLLSRDGTRELATWSGLPLDPQHRSAGAPDSVFDRFATEPASLADARNLPLVVARDKTQLSDAFDLLTTLFGADPTAALEPSAAEAARNSTVTDKLTLGVAVSYLLDGGNDGLRPGASEVRGEADLAKGYALGLRQFEDIEDISMVAAPGSTWNYSNVLVRTEANATMGHLIAHAELMRYRVALLDAGDRLTISEVRGLRAKIDSKHAALYYPWVTVLDPVTRQELNLPPSGFVAGICARNDVDRGVWKAPANEVVRLAIGFETLLNKGQQEVLNPEGINCFRFFEGRGLRLWGARTISSDPEWKYFNVRRYFAYIERSIDKGTQWAVFEPNGDALWANVRATIRDFLTNEWASGALLGDKPEKAFFVRCDRSTMTQNDLDNGRLVCLIGIAPLKPAEFVIFRIGQWTADRNV